MTEQSAVSQGPIFVGGTGRSGTSILARALGTHPDVWTVPVESRILIDPGGLVDLVDALSIRYSPPTAHAALVRFVELALVELTTRQETPYRNVDLAAAIGAEHYRRTIENFIGSLTLGEYEARVDYWTETALITRARNLARLASAFSLALISGPRLLMSSPRSFFSPRRWQRLASERAAMVAWDSPSALLPTSRSRMSPRWHRPYPVRGLRRHIAKYYDRATIVLAAGEMIDALFSFPMTNAGKRIWCEKTPMNILFLPALAELFPNATFVHVKRDPRGVAWSLSSQRFAPPGLEQSTLWLREVCRAWLAETFRPRNYFEIKLEDLAADAVETLRPMARACGLEPQWNGLPSIEPTKVNHWQTEMDRHDRAHVERVLGEVISRMGYDSSV